jgi:Ulp1 family protease
LFDDGNVIHVIANPEGNHWIYAFVAMTEKKICIIDSSSENFGNTRTLIGNVILQYLDHEWTHHHTAEIFDKKKWTTSLDCITPQQNDTSNCGIFCLLNIFRVMKFGGSGIADYEWKPENNLTKRILKDARQTIRDILLGEKDLPALDEFAFK